MQGDYHYEQSGTGHPLAEAAAEAIFNSISKTELARLAIQLITVVGVVEDFDEIEVYPSISSPLREIALRSGLPDPDKTDQIDEYRRIDNEFGGDWEVDE